jgi:hypothetical protein
MSAIASGNTPVTVPANQGTCVGTFRTAGNPGVTFMVMNPPAASGGNLPRLLLWNMYNRRLARARSIDNGAAYAYATAAWRQARGSTFNQINILLGLPEDAILVSSFASVQSPATNSAWFSFAHGLNTTTTIDFVSSGPQLQAASTVNTNVSIAQTYSPAQLNPGFNYVARMEYAGVGSWNVQPNCLIDAMVWC